MAAAIMDEAMAADSTQQSDHTRASDLGNRSSRIDVISMKDALLQRIGANADEYWNLLKCFLEMRLTKAELDQLVPELIGRANVRRHNEFIYAILTNACGPEPPKVVPPMKPRSLRERPDMKMMMDQVQAAYEDQEEAGAAVAEGMVDACSTALVGGRPQRAKRSARGSSRAEQDSPSMPSSHPGSTCPSPHHASPSANAGSPRLAPPALVPAGGPIPMATGDLEAEIGEGHLKKKVRLDESGHTVGVAKKLPLPSHSKPQRDDDVSELASEFARQWRWHREGGDRTGADKGGDKHKGQAFEGNGAKGGLNLDNDRAIEPPLGVGFRPMPPICPLGLPPPVTKTHTNRAISSGRLVEGEVCTLEGLALRGSSSSMQYSPYDLPDQSMIHRKVQAIAAEHSLKHVSGECAMVVEAAVQQHLSGILRQCVDLTSHLIRPTTQAKSPTSVCMPSKLSGTQAEDPKQDNTASTDTGKSSLHHPITCRDLLTALEIRPHSNLGEGGPDQLERIALHSIYDRRI